MSEAALWFKWTDSQGCRQGFQYDLPKGGTPGKRTPIIKNIQLCVRGYHGVKDPVNFVSYGPRLFLIRRSRNAEHTTDKSVFQWIQLVVEVTDLWAEFEKVTAPASAEFEKAHAWAEYEKVRDHAWAEFEKAPASAEFEKVRAPALASFMAACRKRWNESLRGDANEE